MYSDPGALHIRELPRWILDLLAAPPAAGTGLHPWLYKMACVLLPWRAKEDTVSLLTAAAAGCGRDVTREILGAVAHAKNTWQPGSGKSSLLTAPPRSSPPWPERDLEAIAGIAAEGAGLADLWEASPERLHGGAPDADELTDMLFPGKDTLLCAARSPEDASTMPREAWRGGLRDHSLIVPSPMSARTGRSKDGRESPRCLANTGPRRFLVVEFDFKAAGPDGRPAPEAALLACLERDRLTVPDLCAALLLELAKFAPLLMAVHSGGKSLHGWFPAAGVPEPTLEKFFRTAVRLGADRATWCPCQLIRLPEGRRQNNGRRQRVWFLDPRAIATFNP
jgi:hypothetical protein